MVKFKVGDKVKVKDGYYTGHPFGSAYNLPRDAGTVCDAGDGYIYVHWVGVYSPPVHPDFFDLVETHFPLYSEEAAVKLLTERGYSVQAPPEPLKGKVVLFKGGPRGLSPGVIFSLPLEEYNEHSDTWRKDRPAIAIVDWTEGDGLKSE